MSRTNREKGLLSKQEDSTGVDHKAAPIISSRLWSGLKNPRIVRVSRAFGGKDRHSKVSTVRGLRDRRVRLSVPTAIQLYDLQDRLGLNQPSKVVDWLLNAAQHEIDKLPPLQLPPEGFMHYSQSHETPPRSLAPKGFSFADEPREDEIKDQPLLEKGDNNLKGNGLVSAQVLSHQEILQRPNLSSMPAFLSNTMPYAASYYQWEAANAYISQLGMRSSQPDQAASPVVSVPTSRPTIAIDPPQIVFCPQGIMPSMLPSNFHEFNQKQFVQLQMGSSISQTTHSNFEINSLQLSSPSARHFQ